MANWKSLDSSTPVTTISGASTDSPVFGDGSANSATQATMTSLFGTTGSPASVDLAVGESLTLTATITLTGGSNATSQYRFGIYNDGGQFAFDDRENWTGGWNHVVGLDLFQGRTNGAFVSTGGNAVRLTATPTQSGTFAGDSTASFSLSMTITRDSDTTVDLLSSITGGDGSYSEQFSVEDQETSLFTYNAFGFLAGGNSNLDQATFANVSYSVTSTSDLRITQFSYDASDGNAAVSISGSAGERCKLVEADDLDFSNPDQDPVTLTGASVGTLDGDVVVLDAEGKATVTFDLGTTKSATFLRAENSP